MKIRSIQEAVCRSFGISMMELLSERRQRRCARPRQAAYLLCRDLTPQSYPVIGREFGGRDHTTVMAGISRAEILIEKDREFRYLTEAARLRLRQTPPPLNDFSQPSYITVCWSACNSDILGGWMQ